MRKLFALILSLGLLYASSTAIMPSVEAQKSSSPPSSSGSRPSSSGSKPSFSGGSKPSAPPSGGSKPSFSGGSKPAPSSPPSSSGSKPSSPPSGGGNKPSFSGGGSSTAKPPANTGNKPSFSGGGSNNSTGSKPSGNTYDSKANAAQKKVESRQQMQKAEAPKSSYTVNGKSMPIDPKDRKIEQLRTQLSHEQWANRELRQSQFYSASYYSRPVVVYHDPYSSLFWYYLLDRSIEQQAMWAYCHRSNMDEARYHALLAHDAKLAARVAELERQKVAVDPSYTLPGMDPDLQYSDEYVDAVVNAEEAPSIAGWVCFWVFVVLVVIGLLVWLVFVKEWE